MAIPTDFKGITPVAGTTKTFPIPASSGVYGMDAAGTLAPKTVVLGANMVLLLTATKTDAEIVAAMQAFIERHGGNTRGSAGGFPTQTTLQSAATTTTNT